MGLKTMAAKVLSDAFRHSTRIGKIISMAEFLEKRDEKIANMHASGFRKLTTAFNQNPAVHVMRHGTIVKWRAMRNKLAMNNLVANTYFYIPVSRNPKTGKQDINDFLALDAEVQKALIKDDLFSGLGFASLAELQRPEDKVGGYDWQARYAKILLDTFDECHDYKQLLKKGQVKQQSQTVFNRRYAMRLPQL